MVNEERKVFQQFVGQYGGPAFARRARDVQAAYDSLVEACRRQREEWLTFVRLRLGTLLAMAGSCKQLLPILGNSERVTILEKLAEELQPKLRLPVAITSSKRVLIRALNELQESLERFNDRWQTFIQGLDLRKINELREGYNRFYLLEKECALGSARVARQGFQKLNPLRAEELLKIMPVLVVP